MIQRLTAGRLTPALLSSLALIVATTVAYGLDYAFNVVSFRLLDSAEFAILVALVGVGQVLVIGSRVIQTVVTRYISAWESKQPNHPETAAFFNVAFRSAWTAGLIILVVLLLLSRPLAALLQIPETAPVMALAAAVLFFVVRPVVGGTLQGQQRFGTLGVVQIIQAIIRLIVGIGLIAIGWGAFGAMIALPIASGVALVYGWQALGLRGKTAKSSVKAADLATYSAHTAAGLIGFALLINMDAILVNRFFSAEIAAQYAAAITLGKIVQFFPVAIIMILFPKAASRQAAKRDPVGVLLPAIAIVTAICAGITLIYFTAPNFLLETVFNQPFDLNRNTLGLIGLAMGLLSLVNVWLNFFLSIEKTNFVYLIWVAVLLQTALMLNFHNTPQTLPTIMASTGGILTLAAITLHFFSQPPAPGT